MSTDKCLEIIFKCMRGIVSSKDNASILLSTNASINWADVFEISKKQGVIALVHDAITSKFNTLPRLLKFKWILSVEAIENNYNRQYQVTKELSTLLYKNGITPIILKGFAISQYYPVPKHRECGDVDIFTGVRYNDANNCFEECGAKVRYDYYVHSHISYKGVTIENHQFCIGIRGDKSKKQFASYLERLCYKYQYEKTGNARFIVPSADFNALFLTMHGLNHFLSEGIKLRHILDWALLLKAEQNNIDWTEFYHWTDKMHMTRFADALTAISVRYFGLEITNPAIHTTSPYADRILEDTLFKSEGIHNKGYSAWKARWLLIKNKFAFGWKYHKIYQKSILCELTKNVFAFLFEKNPKLS